VYLRPLRARALSRSIHFFEVFGESDATFFALTGQRALAALTFRLRPSALAADSRTRSGLAEFCTGSVTCLCRSGASVHGDGMIFLAAIGGQERGDREPESNS